MTPKESKDDLLKRISKWWLLGDRAVLELDLCGLSELEIITAFYARIEQVENRPKEYTKKPFYLNKIDKNSQFTLKVMREVVKETKRSTRTYFEHSVGYGEQSYGVFSMVQLLGKVIGRPPRIYKTREEAITALEQYEKELLK